MTRLFLTTAIAAFGILVTGGVTRGAGEQADSERRAEIVAHVGPSRTILVADVEDRISAIPPFQRATFGDSPSAIRHRFLSEVVGREALVLLGAEAEGLGSKAPASYALDRARSSATIRAIRARIGSASAISIVDVRAYYEANRARYESPERYQIWRILCATREEAQGVLDAVAKDASLKTFGDLARDHSQDKATRLRSGNVGFVTEDGSSNEPGLRVDPAVVHAARGVRDGELVGHPVPEGDSFAVVWRRGTIAASKRSAEDVAPQIRDTLWTARVKSETDRLVARLRGSRLHDLNERPLDGVELDLSPPRPSAQSAR
jgi:peptidyl-prolyl cis-trans isomerase C